VSHFFLGEIPLNLSSLSLPRLAPRAHSLKAAAVVCAGLLTLVSGNAEARRVKAHARTHSLHSLHAALSSILMTPVLGPGMLPDMDADTPVTPPSDGQPYSLRLDALHTGESIDIVYRIGDMYIPEALDKLNTFLRDHRTNEVTTYDPKEFDLLHNLMGRLGKPNGVIDVVCGYRTEETNALLRDAGPNTGVAEHSQHIEGHAIDIRVPGASTTQIRNAALSLEAGGVGYYPRSQFVHVDVGPVRTWTFAGVSGRPNYSRHRRSVSERSTARSSHSAARRRRG
jgi:uncharacterized protein YcbK (DUF882 family)